MDYLEEAKLSIGKAQGLYDISEEQAAQSAAQLATACALVAQAELLAALIERLDRVIDEEDNTVYVTTIENTRG